VFTSDLVTHHYSWPGVLSWLCDVNITCSDLRKWHCYRDIVSGTVCSQIRLCFAAQCTEMHLEAAFTVTLNQSWLESCWESFKVSDADYQVKAESCDSSPWAKAKRMYQPQGICNSWSLGKIPTRGIVAQMRKVGNSGFLYWPKVSYSSIQNNSYCCADCSVCSPIRIEQLSYVTNCMPQLIYKDSRIIARSLGDFRWGFDVLA